MFCKALQNFCCLEKVMGMEQKKVFQIDVSDNHKHSISMHPCFSSNETICATCQKLKRKGRMKKTQKKKFKKNLPCCHESSFLVILFDVLDQEWQKWWSSVSVCILDTEEAEEAKAVRGKKCKNKSPKKTFIHWIDALSMTFSGIHWSMDRGKESAHEWESRGSTKPKR